MLVARHDDNDKNTSFTNPDQLKLDYDRYNIK